MNSLDPMKQNGAVESVRSPEAPGLTCGRNGQRSPYQFCAAGVRAACLGLLALSLSAVPTLAASYSFSWNSGFANGGVVPDGNPAGWSDTRNLAGIPDYSTIDLDVTLHLQGGWNGDLYAYLTHETGFSVLLNRVGRTGGDPFGYSDAGFDVVLDDAAVNGDIHLYGVGTITGGAVWQPDARNVNPLNVTDVDPRSAFLVNFVGTDPNGDWTLFVADLSNGEASTVAQWGLNITAIVPEASNIPSILLVGLGALAWLQRRRATRR